MTNHSDTSVLDELAKAVDANGGRAGFAGAIGITQAYLSQILKGRRPLDRLPMSTVRKISEASGMPLDRLATAPLAPDGEGA